MKKTFIIAEIGVNHNGDVKTAQKLVDAAVDAGVDAVKFQTFKSELVISQNAPKAEYQKKATGENESQLEMVRKLELDENAHKELLQYCQKKGVVFLSTPFDFDSIDLLDSLGLEIFKIPSGEITNLPYLRKIGTLKKKIILSTGMSDLKEVNKALDILMKAGTSLVNISVLHCNTEYPTPFCDVNLQAMVMMKKKFGMKVGYSDHTLGIEVPIAAVALGAEIIEKHITLDRKMEGPDHRASLEPQEFKQMVQAIRSIEQSLGDGEKKPSCSEKKNIFIARRSIVASSPISKGDVFCEKNITVKRPAAGLSPMKWDKVLGSKAKRDFGQDEMIEL